MSWVVSGRGKCRGLCVRGLVGVNVSSFSGAALFLGSEGCELGRVNVSSFSGGLILGIRGL